MLVKEEINFIRTGNTKKSLEVGFENNPWLLHDYIINIFKEKEYFTRESGRSFEKNDYYSVIFNMGVSLNEFSNNYYDGLSFIHYKPNRNKFKFGVDHFHSAEEEDPLFRSNNWEECINYVDQNIEKWS